MKHLVKRGRKIVGFVFQDAKGYFWYAFGKPSRPEYVAFACNSIEDGEKRINDNLKIYEPA
jgi:hypothetical protein